MANGLGAGFLTLAVLAVVGILGAVAGAIGLVAAGFRRRSGQVPGLLRYLAAGLLVPVGLVAGFGIVALVDEAPLGAALLVSVVVLPFGAVALDRRGSAPVTRTAAAVTAWGGPYLLAVAAFVGVNAFVPRYADLAPAEARALGVGWIAMAVAGVVAVAGAVAVGRALDGVLANG